MRPHAWERFFIDMLFGIVIGAILGLGILMIMNRGFYV